MHALLNDETRIFIEWRHPDTLVNSRMSKNESGENKVEETWVLVRMSVGKDKELYKRDDRERQGLVNFIGKHEVCVL